MNKRWYLIVASIVLFIITGTLLLRKMSLDRPANVVVNTSTSRNTLETEKITRMQQQLQGKDLSFIEAIITDSIRVRNERLCIFLFSAADCHSCLSNAFALIKQMDAAGEEQRVYVFSASDTESNQYQQQMEYAHPIYQDHRDILREKLYYFYTPVFLILDKNLRIKHVYYPERGNDLQFKEAFLSALN